MADETTPVPDTGMAVPSVPQSVAAVRQYAVRACLAFGFRGDCDTVALLVSEVTTNAVVHGAGQVHVRVVENGPRLRVEVSDDSDLMPLPRSAGPNAEGGRGLALVAALSVAWGTEPRSPGKTVWFELVA